MDIRTYLVAGLAAVSLAACGASAENPRLTEESTPPPPATVSAAPDMVFSEAGIAALEARMAAYVENGTVKGLSSILVHKGEVISLTTDGIRRSADEAPVTEDTIFRIYSMTKPITGVAMLMLYEEGAFALDDPITKFVPEFSDLQVLTGKTAEDGTPITQPVSRPPTMFELMTHTAGFAYGLTGEDPANLAMREQQVLSSPDFDTFLAKVAAVPLLHEPGTDWYYSVSTDIQGAIIERITGEAFADVLETRIFAPLGMTNTGFFVPEATRDQFSDLYGYDPYTGDLSPMTEPWTRYLESPRAMDSGGGGLVSTLGDYARFCDMLVNGGTSQGIQLLKPETVALMIQDHLREDQSIYNDGSMGEPVGGVRFGLNTGLFNGPPVSDLGFGPRSHFWGGLAGTWYWIDPDNDLYFIGMVQRIPTGGPPVNFRATAARYVYGAMAKDE